VHRQSTGNTIWAVVPLKSPDAAKSRLRAGLGADARRRLFFSMARQVLHALARTPGIGGVSVVTASPEVAAFAEREGAAVIWEERDAGTAEACRSAVTHFSASVDSLLMISGDIPLISSDAVAALLETVVSLPSLPRRGGTKGNGVVRAGSYHPAHDVGTPPLAGGEVRFFSPPFQGGVARSDGMVPVVAIVPDRRRSGTNALLCTPPAIIPPCFGADSFQRHLAAARSQGVDVRVVESDALGLDIDELEDLDELQRRLDADPALLSAELREALPRQEEIPAQ
jgi:2-phospho-L-lactate guanylyltransferase